MGDLTLDQIKEIGFTILTHTVEVLAALAIPYMLDFGTLLGSMRHSGYIPWDDDIDISIAPNSVQPFIELGPALLPDYLAISPNKTRACAFKVSDTRYQALAKGLTPGETSIEHPAVDIFTLGQYHRFASLLPTRTMARVATARPSATARSMGYRRINRPFRAAALSTVAVVPKAAFDTYARFVDWVATSVGIPCPVGRDLGMVLVLVSGLSICVTRQFSPCATLHSRSAVSPARMTPMRI